MTAWQVHDVTVATNLIVDFKPEVIIADSAYDSDTFRAQIIAQDARACIKPRRNRKVVIPFDKEQYKERHLVECFFQKLKRYRRIATRYDKLAKRFLAFIYIACILLWLL
jgi:transposase